VVVDSIGGNVRVAMRPPVTVNCRMVVALHAWLEKDVQPAARDLLGEEITEIRGATGYQCRNRADTGRTSEHGFANAIDIFGFVTRSGRQLSVRDDWGPPERVLGQADDQTGDEPQTEPEFRRSAENMTRQRKRVASQAPSPLPKKGKATRRPFASVEPTPASDRAPPAARGILVQPLRTATECEFELVPEAGQVIQRAQTLDREQPPKVRP
jgi:Extensin-like protein C-terminus